MVRAFSHWFPINVAVALALAWQPPASAANAPSATPPTQVMIVGGFHMTNPHRDLHDVQVDDVLAPKRQAEIVDIVHALARFHPDKVAAEWSNEDVAARYAKYLDGTLPPSANEVVQLGFRLAREVHAQGMYGIDVEGDFPYDAVRTYADAHNMAPLLNSLDASVGAEVATESDILAKQGISATLRYLNDPATIRTGQGIYRAMLRFGSDAQQPGADLLTAWYRRNFLICANLLQRAKPGDRIVVFYGAGHAALLRQCVSETPGFELVEANDYLPHR